MNNDDYGDGGIDWLKLPLPNEDARSSTDFINASRLDDRTDFKGHVYHQTYGLYQHENIGNSSITSISVEYELRAEIQRLNDIIVQKDDSLFSLESSLATVEVEAKHAISLAESSALGKVRQLEEDIRRMTKEADITRLDIIKSKQVHQQQIQQIHKHYQQGSQLHQQLSHQKNFKQVDASDDVHLESVSGGGLAIPTQIHDHGLSAEMNVSPRDQNSSQPQQSIDPKHKVGDHFADIITRSSFVAAKLLQQSNALHGDQNFPLHGSHLANCIILHMINIPSLYFAPESSGNLISIGGLVREMMRVLVHNLDWYSKGRLQSTEVKNIGMESSSGAKYPKRVREDCKVDNDFYHGPNVPPDHNQNPLHSAISSLNIFMDLLSVSAEARKELRSMLSMCQYLNESSFQSSHSQPLHSSSIRDPTRVISRIRGLPKTETLMLSLTSAIMDINEGASGCSVTSGVTSIDSEEESHILCAGFMSYISDIVTGILPSSTSFQVSIITFLLTLMIDSCPESSKFALSGEMVSWRALLSIIFPYSKIDQKQREPFHTSRDLISILESALGDQPDFARRRFGLFYSSSSKPEAVVASSETKATNLFQVNSFTEASSKVKLEIMLLKISTMQLLIKLLQSSRSARDKLMHSHIEDASKYRPEVTHTRRVIAATLDELQAFAIPLLSTHDLSNQTGEISSMMLQRVLSLCINSIRLISVICEFDAGFTLVRTRMKTVYQADGSTKDALPALSIIADIFVLSGRTLFRACDESSPQATPLLREWSVLFGDALVFFKICLNHVQRLRKMIDEGHKSKRELVTLNAILNECDRKESFCSICRTLLLTNNNLMRGVVIEEDSYRRIIALLDEIAFDEEDEDVQNLCTETL